MSAHPEKPAKQKETFEEALNENPNSSLACQGLGDIFLSIEELEAYLDNLVSGNFTTESSEIEIGQQNTRKDTHTLHFSSFPQAKIVATVKLREPNGLDVLLNGPNASSLPTLV